MPTFDTPEPIAVTIELAGDVRIHASDRGDTVVEVRHRRVPGADVQAAEQTQVEYAGGRLLVATQDQEPRLFGGAGSIDVAVELPATRA